LFCLGESKVEFRDIFVETKRPRAFVVTAQPAWS
jgi:hypothetical protein